MIIDAIRFMRGVVVCFCLFISHHINTWAGQTDDINMKGILNLNYTKNIHRRFSGIWIDRSLENMGRKADRYTDRQRERSKSREKWYNCVQSNWICILNLLDNRSTKSTRICSHNSVHWLVSEWGLWNGTQSSVYSFFVQFRLVYLFIYTMKNYQL